MASSGAHLDLGGELDGPGLGGDVIVFSTARDHARIGFWEFLRVGAPITVATTLAGVGLLLVLS